MKLSPKEVSAVLKSDGYDVSTKTIQRMCQRKKIKGAVKIGRLWFIPESSIPSLIVE